MALSTTRLGSRMPRLVESVRSPRTSLPYEKACLLAQKFEVKGRLPVKGISPRVTLQNLTALSALLDCWLQIPGDLRMHCRSRLDFLCEVSWIIGA